MKNILEIKNISKDYTDSSGYSIHLLEDISLTVNKGSITSILAPTGAGKSSLLKIICGLEKPTTGTINFESGSEKLVFIPSKSSSFPWYSVYENVELVVKDKSRIKKILEDVGLEGYENHYADNNSTGFRFRIALARALAAEAKIIVLDEPFSSKIKPVTNERIYELIFEINKNYGITFLLGTSNLSESILLSNKIYLMQKTPGKVIDSISIEFANQRTVEFMNDDLFVSYRNTIEESLKKNRSQNLSNITV